MQNYESDSDDELPSGWQETVSADGQILYENIYEKIVQKNHPRTGYSKKVSESIPAGWKLVKKNEDEIVFVNEETGFETKVDPRLVFTKDVFDNKEFVQKFDSYSTALQVLSTHNLKDKIAIITGASAGIGLETAYSLMKHNCFVIFACRNRKKTEKEIEKLAENRFFNSNLCEIIHLDLASLESVKQFAKEVCTKYKRIDYLILNAAVFGINYEQTMDGFETIFQVCHLSHFYLTLLIGKKLLGAGSRVIVLSSEAHRYATIFNGTTITKETLSPSSSKLYYHAFAYSNAKLLNILFANELSRKWSNRDISVFSVHPGNFVYSQFPNNSWFCKAVFFLLRPFTKSLQQAAATTVFAIVSENPEVFSGSYLNNCCLCPQSSTAANSHLAENIWSISESMIFEKLGQTAYHM